MASGLNENSLYDVDLDGLSLDLQGYICGIESCDADGEVESVSVNGAGFDVEKLQRGSHEKIDDLLKDKAIKSFNGLSNFKSPFKGRMNVVADYLSQVIALELDYSFLLKASFLRNSELTRRTERLKELPLDGFNDEGNNGFDQFLEKIDLDAGITFSEERELLVRYNRGRNVDRVKEDDEGKNVSEHLTKDARLAKDRLIESHLSLVVSISKNFIQTNRCDKYELGDLVGIGIIGLYKAVERFDLSRPRSRLVTLAMRFIVSEIDVAVLNIGNLVSLSYQNSVKIRGWLSAKDNNPPLKGRLDGEDLIVDDLKLFSSVKVEEIGDKEEEGDLLDELLVLKDNALPDSLNVDSLNVCHKYEQLDLQRKVEELLVQLSSTTLNSDELLVIRARFGIGMKRMTLHGIGGELLNVSRERVRQIEDKALRKIRRRKEYVRRVVGLT